jgi:hypothetical protein
LLRKLFGLLETAKFNKDILKLLTRINEYLLKDIAGIATNFSQGNPQNFWATFYSSMNVNNEEESKENFLEPSNYGYIFEAIAFSLEKVLEDLNNEEECFITSTANTKMNRILGVKRYNYLFM